MEIKQGQSTQVMPYQESTSPSQEALARNFGISEMVDRKRFYGTSTGERYLSGGG